MPIPAVTDTPIVETIVTNRDAVESAPTFAEVRAEASKAAEAAPPPETPPEAPKEPEQPKVAETPAEPAKEPEKAPEPGAWAAVTKAQKQARELAKQAKADAEAAKKSQAAADAALAKAKSWEDAKASAKTRPLALLEEAGLTIDDVIRAKLSDTGTTPELQAQALDAWKAEQAKQLEAERQARLDLQKQIEAKEHAVQLATFKGNIGSFLNSAPDDYALLLSLHDDAKEAVFQRIDAHYAESGGEEVLSFKDAADQMEAELLESLSDRIPKLLPILEKRGKYKPTPAPVVAAVTPPPQPPAKTPEKAKPVTAITNDTVAASPPTAPKRGLRSEAEDFDAAVEELRRANRSKKTG